MKDEKWSSGHTKSFLTMVKEAIMKRFLQLGFLGVCVLGALSATGNAQVSQQYAVNVPFDFAVGNKVMKSGEYTIEPLSGITNQRSIIFRSRLDGRSKLIGQASIGSSDSDKAGRLTFAKYGDNWVLQQVVTPGYELKLKGSKPEQDIGKATETKSEALSR